MENASKALIIAGAILISILIISLGIMIYNQASSIVQNNQLQDFEITAFNTRFTQYEGKKTGAQVKTLIQEIISTNSNPENDSRLVNIDFSNKPSDGDCASAWPDGDKKPELETKTSVKNSSYIKSNAKYRVWFDQGNQDGGSYNVGGSDCTQQAGLIWQCHIYPC